MRRLPELARYERAEIDTLLDRSSLCHVGLVDDGRPVVIPTLYVRRGDDLVLHGSVASRLMRHVRDGSSICVTVTEVDGLVLASAVAALLLMPFAVGTGGSDLLDPRVLLIGAAVGLLSSVIPYSCELVALRTLSPGVFGILMSLEPAAAALAGIVVLGELLGPLQYAAIACVVVASVGATRSGQQAVLRD